MSSTANRRFKRQKERDFRKGKIEEYLNGEVKNPILKKIIEEEIIFSKNLGNICSDYHKRGEGNRFRSA